MKSKAIAIIGALVAATWGGWNHAAAAPRIPTYLALGDSLAYGMQIGHIKAEMKAGNVDAASFDTGYVNRLAAKFTSSIPGLHVVDLGCPGETTTSFIYGPCAFATDGKPFGNKPLPMHVAYKGAQLLAGLRYIRDKSYDIKFITITIGINDLRADELQCGSSPDFKTCFRNKWPKTEKNISRNLNIILYNVRHAAPHTKIAVMTYYNWLAIRHPSSSIEVRQLNRIITRSAQSIGAITVHTFPSFNQSGKLCDLSLYCGPTKDLHPTNAGYELIADLFYRKLK